MSSFRSWLGRESGTFSTGRGVGRGGHRGTSGNSRDPGGRAAAGPATNTDRNVRRPPKMNYDMIRS